jgi:hypothetical protein
MAIYVNWHNSARTIIVWQFGSTWTWDEFYSNLERNNRMLNQVAHQVSVIIDMLQVESFPRGIMTHAINAITARPSNSGLTIMLMENAALRVLYNSLLHMIPRLLPGGSFTMLLGEDMEHALRLIQERQAASHSGT